MRLRSNSWRRAHWRGVPVGDLVLAGALLVMAATSVVMGRPAEGPIAVCLPVAVVMSVAVGWRRRAPLLAAAVIAVAAQAQTFTGASPGQVWSLAVYLLAVYSVAAHLAEGRAAVGGAVLVGGLLLQELQVHGSDYLFIVIVFGGAWLVGRALRGWQSRATLAETHQRDVARLAVSDERIRMSRELHDVVAHGLSVIAVQADAAEAALAHDPALAAEPLRAIKAGARQSLQELRQMLQVLRDDEDASPGWSTQPPRPAPGIGALAELVQGVRAAGLPLEWVLDGPGADPAARPADDLAGGVELAVYRIVQEALTNVLKHAGRVPTWVRVRIDESAVDVEVCNAAGAAQPSAPADGGRRADGGRGLIGVRERVAALHGSVEAGPIDAGELAGGYRLHARLPRGAAARSAIDPSKDDRVGADRVAADLVGVEQRRRSAPASGGSTR